MNDKVGTRQRPASTNPLPGPARGSLPSAAVAGLYLLIGLVPFWSALGHISRRLFGVEPDYIQGLWFLGWTSHALGHGLNPFFSHAIFVPAGVNLVQNTSSPLLGLIIAPLVAAFGPLVAVNILFTLAMPLSATAAFMVLRRLQVWGPAAALGGLIYGFSPYMVGHALAHPELTVAPLPPFIALTVVSIVQRKGSPWRLGTYLGLLVAAQFLISPEVLTTVALFTVVALAYFATRERTNLRDVASRMLLPAAIAFGVAALLLAYPLWMFFAGPQHVAGPLWPIVNPYHNDLLSFVAPGPLQKFSLGMRALGTRLSAASGAPEAGGYVGAPVLFLTGILAWRSRRRLRTQVMLVLLFSAALLSLGPRLAVDGHLTRIPLPFAVMDHIPLLDSILPARLNFEVAAFVAGIIAFGIDDLRRRGATLTPVQRPRPGRYGGTVWAAATLAVLGATQLPAWPLASQYASPTAVVLPGAVRRAIPAGDPVAITYPYATAYNTQPMLWQVDDGFRFRLLGGYGYHPSEVRVLLPSLMKPRGLQRFLAGQEGLSSRYYGTPLPLSPELVRTTRTTLARYHVRLVIVDRSALGSGPVVELFDAALGPPTVSSGPFTMWASGRHSL